MPTMLLNILYFKPNMPMDTKIGGKYICFAALAPGVSLSCTFTIINDKVKQLILTFKKLDPANG